MKKESGKIVVKENQKRKWILVAIVCILLLAIIIGIMIIHDQDVSYTIEEIGEYQYFKLYENGKYGVIDKEGKIVIEPNYDMVQIPNPSKAIFICADSYDQETGEYKTKVYNEKTEELFSKYEQVKALAFKEATTEVPFEKSVLAYRKDGKYGILDFSGKEITKAIYDSIESLLYKEGCLVVSQNGKYGIINIKGKQIIKPEYDTITADGYYHDTTKYQAAGFIVGNKTQEGYRYGYMNYKGEKLLDTTYNEVDRVTELMDDKNVYLVAFQKGQAAILKNKAYIIKHEYEDIEYNRLNQLFIVQKAGKQGIVDLEGNSILKPEYDNVLIAGDEIQAQKDGNTKVFDKKGEPKNKESEIAYVPVADGKYYITMTKDNQYGIVDKDKKSRIATEYAYVEYAFEDYFIVTREGKIGIVDATTGENKVPFIYQVIQKIEGSFVLQAINTQTNTTEFYNKEMKKTASVENATIFAQGTYIKVLSDKQRIYLDLNGNIVENTQLFAQNALFAKKQNDKWGFVDKSGNQKVEAIYDMVTELNRYGFAGIQLNGKWGVIDAKGNILVQPIYEIEWQEPEFIGKYCKLNFGYGLEYYTDELAL